jgi:hypothetical protein
MPEIEKIKPVERRHEGVMFQPLRIAIDGILQCLLAFTARQAQRVGKRLAVQDELTRWRRAKISTTGQRRMEARINGPCGNGAGWPMNRLQITRHSPPRCGFTAMRSPTIATHSPRSSFSLMAMAVSGPMSVTDIKFTPASGAISLMICLKRWAFSLKTRALMILLPSS